MLRFSDTTKWIGSALRYDAQDDRHDQIRLLVFLSTEFFDAQMKPYCLGLTNRICLPAIMRQSGLRCARIRYRISTFSVWINCNLTLQAITGL